MTTEFEAALHWRAQPSALVYGVWDAGDFDDDDAAAVAASLLRAVPRAQRVSPFRCFDDDLPWPCVIGVFEIDLPHASAATVEACGAAVRTLTTAQARHSWMMFEGPFVDLHRLFAPERAAAIYAIDADGGAVFALDDAVRHGRAWQETVERERARFVGFYPTVNELR